MKSADGEKYLTDEASTQQLLRLIQSIPSPKAEPFKQWMAQVAAERLDQMQDPELSTKEISQSKNPETTQFSNRLRKTKKTNINLHIEI